MTTEKKMSPEVSAYYQELKSKNELTRSDVSIYPSYTNLSLAYFVVCRQRYCLDGIKHRKQFMKEIKIHESLQHRALDGVRVHREFCNPILIPPAASEIIKFTPKERMRLENILTAIKIVFRMFANAFQSGFISVFYSVGSNPLSLWDKSVKNGHIRRVVDDEIKSLVLEISGTNVATTYITCPLKAKASLGIKLPFLVMVIKNLKKYFTFEIQIVDDKDMRRRFRVSNFQSTTKVRPFCTTMPIGLSPGWNQVQFNLADFTKRAYGSTYIETVRMQIHANVRIRRIYFSDRLYSDDEMPNEFKLFLPLSSTQKREGTKKPEEPERKPSKEAAASVDKIQQMEEEIPSVAPPATPAEESPKTEETETVTELEVLSEVSPSDVEAEPSEAGAEELPEEGEGVEAAEEAAPAEPQEIAEEVVSEAPAPADEEVKETAEEEAQPPEAPAEEAPSEEAPAEEPPAEEPPAEEPPAPAEEEATEEAPPPEE